MNSLHLCCTLLLFVAATSLTLGSGTHFRNDHGNNDVHSPLIISVPQSCSAAANCSAAITSAISTCRQKAIPPRMCVVALARGDYQMQVLPQQQGRVISLDNLKNFQLVGSGSNATTLVFDNLSQFFVGENCQKITLRDFSVDMNRVPFTLGKVISTNAHSSTLIVPDQQLYPTDPATQKKYPYLNRAQAIIGYVPATERYTTPDIYSLADPFPVSYHQKSKDDGIMMMVIQKGNLPVGEWLVVRHQVYALNAFSFSRARDLVLSDVVLYAAGGMGFVASFTTNITLQKFETRRRRDSSSAAGGAAVRAMSICADGIHITNSLGGTVTVTECTLEGQGDDGMNINTPFARIVSMSADRRTVQLTGYQNRNVNSYFVDNNDGDGGDVGEVFSGRTMAFKTFTSKAKEEGGAVHFASPLPPSVDLYDLIVNNRAQVSAARIYNNRFINNRARGVLLKQGNAILQNNTFSGQTSPAILAQIDGCFWYEGRPFVGWSVLQNTIEAPDGFGPATVISVKGSVAVYDPTTGKPTAQCRTVDLAGVFANATIAQNTITSRPQSVEKSISIYATQGVQILGNRINSPDRSSSIPDIQTTSCSKVRCGVNKCYDYEKNKERKCVVDV